MVRRSHIPAWVVSIVGWRLHRQSVVFALLVGVIASVRCATTDELAPPAGAVLSGLLRSGALPTMSDPERATIELGRFLYVTDCADCHAPEPVLAHTLSAWQEILPRMAHESKMNSDEVAAVRAYVSALHRLASTTAR